MVFKTKYYVSQTQQGCVFDGRIIKRGQSYYHVYALDNELAPGVYLVSGSYCHKACATRHAAHRKLGIPDKVHSG